jgi:4-amino-4-deoxy-L-arabinose transferase-like glycosyltransferase
MRTASDIAMSRSDDGVPWLSPRLALLVFAYALTLTAVGTGGSTRVLTRHEVLAAEPARQILRGQSWAVQSFAGQPRLVKPPTMSWLIATMMKVTGSEAEWVARFPSALSGALLAVVVAWLAARFYGEMVGTIAGLMQGSFYYVLLQARLSEADMPMALAVTVAMTIFAVACVEPAPSRLRHRWTPAAFYAATAVAFLLKGPVGPAFVLLGCGAYAVIARQRRIVSFLLNPLGLIAFVLIGSIWPVAAMIERPDIVDVWWRETVGRFEGKMGEVDKSDPVYAYVIAVPLLLLPWLPFVIGGAYHVVRYKLASRPLVRFCLCWFVPGIALLTLSAWRSKHYAIPILPPLTILAARCLQLHLRGQMTNAKPTHAIAIGIIAALGVAGTVVAMTVGAVHDARWPLVVVIWAAVAGGVTTIYLENRRRLVAELTGLFATAWVVALLALLTVLPKFDGYRASANFGSRVTAWQWANVDRPVYMVGLGEAHVAYYLKGDVIRVDDVSAFVGRLKSISRDDAYVVTETDKGVEALSKLGHVEPIFDPLDRERDDLSSGALPLTFVRFSFPRPVPEELNAPF